MSLERRLNIKDDERLLSVVRASFVTIIAPAIVVAMLLLAPLFFMTPLLRLETLGYIAIGVLLFLGLFIGSRGFVKWWFSLLAVTEKRLIIIRQKGFFEREVVELPFSRVHEVSYRVKGVFATMFGYGTVMIESAGSDEPICMDCVHRPAHLQDLMTGLQGHASSGPGDFGEMLHAVSRLDDRKLSMLKAEIDRTLKSR